MKHVSWILIFSLLLFSSCETVTPLPENTVPTGDPGYLGETGSVVKMFDLDGVTEHIGPECQKKGEINKVELYVTDAIHQVRTTICNEDGEAEKVDKTDEFDVNPDLLRELHKYEKFGDVPTFIWDNTKDRWFDNIILNGLARTIFACLAMSDLERSLSVQQELISDRILLKAAAFDENGVPYVASETELVPLGHYFYNDSIIELLSTDGELRVILTKDEDGNVVMRLLNGKKNALGFLEVLETASKCFIEEKTEEKYLTDSVDGISIPSPLKDR